MFQKSDDLHVVIPVWGMSFHGIRRPVLDYFGCYKNPTTSMSPFGLMSFSELPNLPSKLPPKMASRELFWSLWGPPREAQHGPKRGQERPKTCQGRPPAAWGAVCSHSWVWGSGQRRRSDGQIKGLGRRPGELYVAIPGFGGLGSGDGRTDRLMVWGGGLGSCM